jgi:dienelactone hydrolase
MSEGKLPYPPAILRRLFYLTVLCLCLLANEALAARTDSLFKIDDKNIRVEIYRPHGKAGDRYPAVLLLHGSGGIEPQGGFFRQLAEDLEKAGFVVAIVRYMDRYGLDWADNKQMAAHFSGWVRTVRDSISFLQKQAFVRSDKIGVMGHSLGGQLALSEAATDRRVACLVDMAGSLVGKIGANDKMPPILILHGDRDKIVPISRERQLEIKLQSLKVSYQKQIYHGEGHTFDGVSQDVIDRSVAFFRQQLMNGK